MDTGEGGASKGKLIGAALVGLALLASVGLSVDFWPRDAAPVAPPATTSEPGPVPTGQTGFSLVQAVAPGDREAALGNLKLDSEGQRQARAAVESGAAQIGTLTVFDYGQEDGDVVQISGSGVSQIVPILKQPTKVTVLYVHGTPLKVLAYKDGSSPGITVTVRTSAGNFRLRSMKEGETVEIATP